MTKVYKRNTSKDKKFDVDITSSSATLCDSDGSTIAEASITGDNFCCQIAHIGGFEDYVSEDQAPNDQVLRLLRALTRSLREARVGGFIASVSDENSAWLWAFKHCNSWALLRTYPAVSDRGSIHIFWCNGTEN